ncbi:hypothetical protein VOLCADRAFT_108355 [Volvox carteri f. nagariensis]|uniref:NADP-dependent oxidoreductase domain-containing protein n=1 Tax=Volvox carteri f. nagariensis TaxID=3068 RepID=D8UJN2_VOLCA|nr:uncharacterized protein VOLCADRAFT_108355 [Volvox carteri f. nagariensis]EFJ40051.1 hypothetical protein VOLCADRAFT_108355 [Volvox carteri f. nagariensis]|eukprot:XP_002958863.1 hypothetical protein VOLCADRAFT_108355 [Volvox carteri f. nagariensis]
MTLSKPLPRTITLHNGVELPAVGLGTFRAQGDDARTAVLAALRSGLRHIDTASIYKNEAPIRQALAESGVPREDVFVTSKVSPYEQGAGRARTAVEGIMERLGLQYLDLVLIHWPGVSRVAPDSPLNAQMRLETWRELEQLYGQGVVRAIGVSNYEESHVRQLLDKAEVKPMVNQFEVHPRRQRRELRRLCGREGIAVVAYTSLGSSELLSHPVVQQVAAEVGRTPAQVLLRWGLQEGCAVIPKSVRPERISEWREELLLGADWALGGSHMAALGALEDGHKYCWDPEGIV